MDPELARPLALLPRLDYADPAAVRARWRRYLALTAAAGFRRTADALVEVIDRTVPGRDGRAIPVRTYRPLAGTGPLPAVVYLHGGAFVVGDLDFEHPRCLEMAAETGCAVFAVDYRLAPEHPFPAGFEDCLDAFAWAVGSSGADPARVAVAGSSAGGALAAAVALAARDAGGPRPAFQLLLYPVCDDRLATASMAAYVDSPGWNRRDSEHMWRHYLPRGSPPSPYAAPARATDLAGLSPAYVMTAEVDALRDEGIGYAHHLLAAGVPVELHHFPGTFHGFDTLADAGISRRARAEQYAVLRAALRGRGHTGDDRVELLAHRGGQIG